MKVGRGWMDQSWMEGAHVGGGGLADDLGENIVALMATGRGTTGGLVVGVGEELLDGGDEPALPRGVSSWGSSLGWQRCGRGDGRKGRGMPRRWQ